MTIQFRFRKRTHLMAIAVALGTAGAALSAPGLLQTTLVSSSTQILPAGPADTNLIGRCGTDADLTNMAVFTATNEFPANQVIAYVRHDDGTLCEAGRYATGGIADTAGIVNSGQDSILLSDDGWLFVLNAGSLQGQINQGSISVFHVDSDRLVLTQTIASGGPAPRSITRHDDLVYVVNAGAPGDASSVPLPELVQGFHFDNGAGQLAPLAGGHARTLDADGNPAQIGFSSDGRHLVVSQRRVTLAPGEVGKPEFVEVFPVNVDGTVGAPRRQPVGAAGSHGFRFDGQNRMYLVHGDFRSSNGGGASSFSMGADGHLTALTSREDNQSADTCWNAISRKTDAPYFYTSSYFDSAIAQWRINPDGGLELVDGVAASSAASGGTQFYFDGGGMDLAISTTGDAEYLYVLNNPAPQSGQQTARIVGYRIASTGELTQIGKSVADGLPNSGFGLAAH